MESHSILKKCWSNLTLKFQEEILQSELEKRASKSKSRRKRKHNESDPTDDPTSEIKTETGDGGESKKKKKRRKKKKKPQEAVEIAVCFRIFVESTVIFIPASKLSAHLLIC